MPIKVQSTQTIIAANCWEAKSIFGRARGLLGRRFSNQMDAMLFRKNNSIHMWFMRYEIDVIYLREGKIVKQIEGLKPWQLSACKDAQDVIELPAGTIEQHQLQVGDLLEVVSDHFV